MTGSRSARSATTWPPRQSAQPEEERPQETKDQLTALHSRTATDCKPQTYALRCTDRTCPIGPNSKVNQRKKPQVRDLTRVSPWSRLRDSNPRPTHYEGLRDRDGGCRAVVLGTVFAGQRRATERHVLVRSGPCQPVRSRTAHARWTFHRFAAEDLERLGSRRSVAFPLGELG